MTDLEIVLVAKQHQNTCFLCRWTVEDFEKNGKLTGYPNDFMDAGTFPRSGKENHAKLESGVTI